MTLLLVLEALAALLILVGIVWWTMFSGRPRGEPPRAQAPAEPVEPSEAASEENSNKNGR